MANTIDPNNMNYEVKPARPEDVPPPPSYEDVMGQYVTSVQHGQMSLPSLAYIDIMPRLLDPGNIKGRVPPTFQSFDDLVTGANVWLTHNPGLSVWKCETVERKVGSGHGPGTVSIDLESTVQHEATFGFNCFVFGLRLWLTPKAGNQQGVQEIGMRSVLPEEKEIDITLHYGGLRRRYMGFGFGISQQKTMISYEGLTKSLKSFNEKIKDNPIPGAVLNIESTTLKFAEGLQQMTVEAAAYSAMWYELDGQTSKRYTQILRIYYIKGSPTTPEINMKEFLPSQLNNPKTAFEAVRYDTFSKVICQAAVWVQQQAGIQIANIETRFADTKRLMNHIQVDTDSTDHFDFGLMTATKLRFMRIFYISNSAVPSFEHASMSSRLFVPVSLGGNKFETMTQSMARIDAWMRAVGLPIFGVETVPLLREYVSGKSQERCEFDLKPFSSKYWVDAIRVYFPSGFVEPEPNPFPPQMPALQAQASSTCNIL